jgi:L-Lysine epsilon oxidase N-terminal/L-lysine epsilon oxidase C-terminal domain
MPSLRIHPAIGVARIGNSDEFFIGPEIPGIPGNWDSKASAFGPFRDQSGRILRQAARFRIFQFDDDGNPQREVTLSDGVRIAWHVHVANRKASFFTFNGQSGAETDPPYSGRAAKPGDAVEKQAHSLGEPARTNKRNASIADRRSLEIDPGEVTVAAPGIMELQDGTTVAPIRALGRIQMQEDGRLLFLGGTGATGFSGANPRPLDEYANNDGWFDDMSDGVIAADVIFPDGHAESVIPAWVIVGPPKFAPGIRNVVTLYDTLWDLAVRHQLPLQAGSDPELNDLRLQQQAWQNGTSDFAATYEPSFLQHIYPVLSRALAVQDVHEPPEAHPEYHSTMVDWPRLSQRSEPQIRWGVFQRIRNPNSTELDWSNMPRGLGDDYTSLDDFENNRTTTKPSPRAYLSITPVQYALLKAWAEGRFKEDWPHGTVRFAPIPNPTEAVTPHGLDCAALENCVGGPFYPGIEVSWLIRQPVLYAAPFRLRNTGFTLGPLTLQAGFFSQQMALPWQADFYDCHKEEHTSDESDEPVLYMWWTAQRPDDIRPKDGPFRRWVSSFDAAKDPAIDDPDDTDNLARLEQMRTRWSELSFVVLEGDEFVERK